MQSPVRALTDGHSRLRGPHPRQLATVELSSTLPRTLMGESVQAAAHLTCLGKALLGLDFHSPRHACRGIVASQLLLRAPQKNGCFDEVNGS